MSSHQRINRSGARGFTLIELLVVIVIIGLGMSIAVPSFQGMVQRNQLVTTTNDFLLAVNLARSEAGRIGGTVTLQAASPVAGDEFGAGYCVVVGDPGSCSDPVVRRFDAINGDATLGSINDAANGGEWTADLDSLSFSSIGALSGTADQLRNVDLCHPDQRGRRIQISLIGRPKSWREADVNDPVPAVQPGCP